MRVNNKISWGYRFGAIFLNSTIGGGFVLLLFAVVITLFITSDMDFSGFVLGKNSPKVKGVITGIDTIQMNNESPKSIIYAYRFTFRKKGTALQVGESYFPTIQHHVVDSVTIRYLEDNPSYAVIEGMWHNKKPFSVWAFVTPILGYLFGLYMVYVGIRKGKRLLNYADYGKATLARFVRQEATSEKGENGAIVQMIFEYETPNRKYEIFSKTETPENFDTKERIVLYLPWDNGDAIFKDDLWS
ncbi:MAG: hypothetical protein EAZ95_00995 [Bacteroidetes bacterium]|nr:MAG: hypothetical protein EAZ95_00995 [Bacteroidota bacterium]